MRKFHGFHLLMDRKFVTDIRTKANIFNEFFTEQCIPLKNGSVLISITMIKICGKSFVKPLVILFQNSLKFSHYPDLWGKELTLYLYIRKATNS